MGLADVMQWNKKKFTTKDVALDELAVMCFTILLVKYWPAVASLEWYWYALVMVLAAIKPVQAYLK